MGKINFCGHIWDIFASSSRNTCQQILYLPIRQSCQLDSNLAWIWNTNHNYNNHYNNNNQKDNYNNQKDNYNNNAHNYNYQKDNYNNKTYYYNNKTNNYINKKDNYNNRKHHYNYTLLQPHSTLAWIWNTNHNYNNHY